MRILIIIPPCREAPTTYPPYGAIYIGTILKHNNHDVKLLNLDVLRYELSKTLSIIEEYNPQVLGFSGIVSTNYRYIKEISHAIKMKFPDMFQVLGGQLSAAATPILENNPIDVIVKGEGEKTIINLLNAINDGTDFQDVKGLVFKSNGKIIYTPDADLISNLDELPFPNYDLINVEDYLIDAKRRFSCIGDNFADNPTFKKIYSERSNCFTIMTGRGCQGKCTFCSRNVRGYRKNSIDYILDFVELIINKYEVGFFTFGDESFFPNKKWGLQFVEKLKERKIEIMFYVLGARVDTVDQELLYALKDVGCLMVEYGFEHGSQRMLDMMEKRATVAENYNAYMWTKRAGLHTAPSNVINMPGESSESITETIQFLKSLKMNTLKYFVNYAQAHPGTPLYDYAVCKGLIKDEEKYLFNLTDIDAGDYVTAFRQGIFINFSEKPLSEVFTWLQRIKFEIEIDYIRRQKNRFEFYCMLSKYLYGKVRLQVERLFRTGLREWLAYFMPRFRDLLLAQINKFKKKTVPAGSKKEGFLIQCGLSDQELINKIKNRRCDSRKVVHSELTNIDSSVEYYNGEKVIRYPSLREICAAIKEQ